MQQIQRIQRRLERWSSMWWIGLVLLGPAAALGDAAADGSVTLPLADYLQLIERIDRAEKARSEPVEPAVAELVSEATSLTLLNGSAEVVTTYQVELRGRPTKPMLLLATGLPESVAVEPADSAALHRTQEGLLFVARRPGRYAVTLRAVAELEQDSGVARLQLAESRAPVATLALDLPAGESWTCSDTVVVEDNIVEERRRLRLAPARGQRPVLELRRRVAGAMEDEARARAVVVTVARAGKDGVERHDVVLYEVQRGELGRFVLGVPATLAVVRASTDEGSALPWIEGERLTVERRHRLDATGHLAVSFRPLAPDAGGEVPLPQVKPAVEVRARYLVLASDQAADVSPLPPEAWSRVDLEDLPQTLYQEIAVIDPGAVWRLSGEPSAPRLRARLLPAVEPLGTVVRRRSTTTLWTVDGSLVHRDRFTLHHAGSSLDVTLPEGATLWSVQVDGQAVRPLERGGEIAVPLVFKAEGDTSVEVVAVEERSIVRGSSRLAVDLARVAPPVLEHDWRLLLPEQHRYRLARSDLRIAPRGESRSSLHVDHLLSPGNSQRAGVAGTLVDELGAPLPGVTVTVSASGGSPRRTAVTDVQGRFGVFGLPPGSYRLIAELDGFATVERQLEVLAGRTAQFELPMQISEIVEEIVVTATTRSGLYSETNDLVVGLDRRQMQESAQRELQALGQGLAGGVKPLQVEIPESGKLLRLAGALPPASVGVELEMRVKR